MKNMKKLVLVLAAVAMLAAGVLAGCAVRASQAPAAPEVPAAAETPAPAEEKVPAADPLPDDAKAAPMNNVVIVPVTPAEKKAEEKPAEKAEEKEEKTPAPAPAPAPTPAPVPHPPVVTMNPGNVTVTEGGSFTVSARYSNAIWAVWHFVSPDGTRDLTYEEMARLVPTMTVENGMYSDMTLRNVTLGLNGWKTYCRYSNNDGYTNTSMAYITVLQDTTPRRTGVSAFAFYEDGTVTYIYQLTDGTWQLDNGAVYYLGTDGVYRSRGHVDLYTQQPHPTPYRTGVSMQVFYENGNATTLYAMSDGSWMTDEGAVYYEGMNGVLHSTGNFGDLYVTAPVLGPTHTGFGMEVFYEDGTITYVSELSDGSWATDAGVIYLQGADGIFRSAGNPNLYQTSHAMD